LAFTRAAILATPFLRASLVPIAAWSAADAEPSYDLVAALDRDPAISPGGARFWRRGYEAMGSERDAPASGARTRV
jgi:hypothetical protein